MSVPVRRRLLRWSAATFVAALAVPALAAGPAAAQSGDGAIHLTVTRPDGTPSPGTVEFVPASGEHGPILDLDATGQVAAELPEGGYRIRIVPPDGANLPGEALAQWVPGTSRYDAAGVVSVAAGTTTEVTERLRVLGSVTVTARNALDGTPLTDVCASVEPRYECSYDGTMVTLPDLVPGPQTISVSAGAEYRNASTSVTVVEGGNVAVTVDLVPTATIETTVVDAGTGRPVAGVCGNASPVGSGLVPTYTVDCSDEAGRLRVGGLAPGRWNLFIWPSSDSGYGMQWVGQSGGTGDVTVAATVTVAAGATARAPRVRLDPAGSIAGYLTEPNGAPAMEGHVTLDNAPPMYTGSLDLGRYVIEGLGPYRWPLLFRIDGYAQQWSGGVAERRGAELIKVRPGRTTGYSPQLTVGTALTGRITDPQGDPSRMKLDLYSARTAEPVGHGDAPDGSYRVLVLGVQDVKLQWRWDRPYASHTGWYDDQPDFAHADPVAIPSQGERVLDLTVDPYSTAATPTG